VIGSQFRVQGSRLKTPKQRLPKGFAIIAAPMPSHQRVIVAIPGFEEKNDYFITFES